MCTKIDFLLFKNNIPHPKLAKNRKKLPADTKKLTFYIKITIFHQFPPIPHFQHTPKHSKTPRTHSKLAKNRKKNARQHQWNVQKRHFYTKISNFNNLLQFGMIKKRSPIRKSPQQSIPRTQTNFTIRDLSSPQQLKHTINPNIKSHKTYNHIGRHRHNQKLNASPQQQNLFLRLCFVALTIFVVAADLAGLARTLTQLFFGCVRGLFCGAFFSRLQCNFGHSPTRFLVVCGAILSRLRRNSTRSKTQFRSRARDNAPPHQKFWLAIASVHPMREACNWRLFEASGNREKR